MEEVKEVVLNTYALMAIVYDEVGKEVTKVLNNVKLGKVKGLIPVTVAYEYVIH